MKLIAVFALIIALGTGSFFLLQSTYGQAPLLALLTSDSRAVTELANKFMEAIQFKDFKAAGLFSSPEQQKDFDIPTLIERLFQIKPEFLDIQKVQVLSTEMDSTGARAKVNLKTEVKVLNTNEIKNPNVILYWKKSPEGKWYMDLATSIK